MTKSRPEEHHDTQETKAKEPRREGDGATAIGINPPPQDVGGPPRGGHGHHHPDHSGKDS